MCIGWVIIQDAKELATQTPIAERNKSIKYNYHSYNDTDENLNLRWIIIKQIEFLFESGQEYNC